MEGAGIFSWFGYRLPLRERLSLIAGAGFAATSLWLGSEEELVAGGRADDMPGLVREAGLDLDYVHAAYAGCETIWTSPEPRGSLAWGTYSEALRFCRRHGIAMAVFHLARSRTGAGELRHGLAFMDRLVKEGEDQGVIVALENTRHNEDLDRVFEAMESPFLGLCYDSSHDGLDREGLGGLLRRWGGLLRATHLSDNLGGLDDHFLPFRGDLEWPCVRDAFGWKGWTGRLNLEVLPDRPQDAPSFLADAMASLARLATFLRES
jgi:sugar phosphate isomerase/epimerase